jgi:hypothetical protein
MSDRCVKCGGIMDIHYGSWCPICDKPEDQTVRVLDFFRVAKYIAAHDGYPYENDAVDNWYRNVLREIEFPGNDCYIAWWVDDPYTTVIEQFNAGLMRYFDVKPGEKILLNISW